MTLPAEYAKELAAFRAEAEAALAGPTGVLPADDVAPDCGERGVALPEREPVPVFERGHGGLEREVKSAALSVHARSVLEVPVESEEYR